MRVWSFDWSRNIAAATAFLARDEKEAPIMMHDMMGGMWGMGLIGLLLVVVLILAAAALLKYLFKD